MQGTVADFFEADSLDGHLEADAALQGAVTEAVTEALTERAHPASYLDSGYFDMAALSAVKDAVAEAVRELVNEKPSSRSPSRSPQPSPAHAAAAPSSHLQVDEPRPPSARPSRSREGREDAASPGGPGRSRSRAESEGRGLLGHDLGHDLAAADAGATLGRSRSRSTDARPGGAGHAGRRDANSRLDTRGANHRYVRGETYMSHYKKKREERERERRKAEQEAAALPRGPVAGRRAADPTATAATTTTAATVNREPQQRPTPRTNRTTEARRARAVDTIRRLDAEAVSKADEDRAKPGQKPEPRKTYIDQPRPHIDDVGRSAIFQVRLVRLHTN